jgi:hypothetical protein
VPIRSIRQANATCDKGFLAGWAHAGRSAARLQRRRRTKRVQASERTASLRVGARTGRPIPPPRARPVVSGVVDPVGYAPVFFGGGR